MDLFVFHLLSTSLYIPTSSPLLCLLLVVLSQCEPTIPKNKNKQKMFIKFVTQHRVVVSHQKYTTIYIYIYRSISYLSIYICIFFLVSLCTCQKMGFGFCFCFFCVLYCAVFHININFAVTV